jgi:prepilin-type processing-associated H-X9-DG protein
LPHLEQDNLYHQINFNLPVESQPAIQSLIKGYLCPSDNYPLTPFAITDATFAPVCLAAPSSYAATVGSDASQVDDFVCNGVFYRNSRTRFADITDGLTTTVFIGDRAWADTDGTWAGAPSLAVTRAGTANPWTNAIGPPQDLILAHNNWINIKTDADGGLDDFSSKHTGGVNLLFGDGSVRFLRSITIDGPQRYAFWAMGTRAGGEIVQGLE